MSDPKATIKAAIEELNDEAVRLALEELKHDTARSVASEGAAPADSAEKTKRVVPFETAYQRWYTKALPVVRQLAPDRYQEFVDLYKLEKRKQIDYETYTISDYLLGLRVTRGIYKEEVVNPFRAFFSKFQHQINIVNSLLGRVDSILTDIEGVLQSSIFAEELDAAEELLKKKHVRAAGALAGVTLEAHLSKVCANHSIKFAKKLPTLSDYYEALKNNNVVDVVQWRFLQRLGDIRNLCVHSKERDPSAEEVRDLIDGTKKAIATVF